MPRALVLSAALLALVGCERLAGYSAHDAAPFDVIRDAFAADVDGPIRRLDGRPDALASVCPAAADPDTVALYVFPEGARQPRDLVTGLAVGALDDPGGLVSFVSDPTVCGVAAVFPQASTKTCSGLCGTAWADCAAGVVIIPMAQQVAARLSVGSVDLWVRFSSATSGTGPEGIISRDAHDVPDSGHFEIWRENGRIAVRLQRPVVDDEDVSLCSARVVADTNWHHIGVNFGGTDPELFVDFQRTVPDGSFVATGNVCTGKTDQGHTFTEGIDGNNEPWVIGASSDVSCRGEALPTRWPMRGAVANVRISRVRRDFSALKP